MKIRIIVPVAEEKGLDSCLAEHFGRAPYFAVIDLDENYEVSKVEIVSNTGEHFGGAGHMHDNILSLKPDAIIVYGMGPRGLVVFKARE
ncbi:MAG: NifB/NifX family molybdenum-iron cluster-binding protein [Thermoproteota archaeon]